jgi:hypothetical protein
MRDYKRLPWIELYLTRHEIVIFQYIVFEKTRKETAYYLRRRFGLDGPGAEVIKW